MIGHVEATIKMARDLDALQDTIKLWLTYASPLNMSLGQSLDDAKAQVDEVFDAIDQLMGAIEKVMDTTNELQRKME